MTDFQTIIILMMVAILLVGLAQKIGIPYPIVLVVGGALIGFIPGIKAFPLNPNLVFVLFLPPILNYAAVWTSLREFKHHFVDVFSLAIGLVIVTTLVIGIIFKWLFPDLPWALALAFGAIVSPPDATSATAILKRFNVGPHLTAVLEGESLVNDASALVLYKICITALLTGVFSWTEASMDFVKTLIGAIIIGAISGFAIQLFSKRFLEPIVGVMLSLVTPYFIYIVAESIAVSGVLTVVVYGLVSVPFLVGHHVPLRRVFGATVWDMFFILVNCFVFILIGLQLKVIIGLITPEQIGLYTGYAFLITLAMMLVRMVWIYGKHFIAYYRTKDASQLSPHHHSTQILAEGIIIGWSGMRGIVSLTAALALPHYHLDGTPLSGRDIVIFITFVVILLTLVIPGLTLPVFLRILKLDQTRETEIARIIRKKLLKVAQDEVNRLEDTNEEDRSSLQAYFNLRHRMQEISCAFKEKRHPLELARLKILDAQRKLLIHLWNSGEIDDLLLRALQLEIDLEETHTVRAEI